MSTIQRRASSQSGFALVEALLIVVIFGVIAGLGVWVYNANQKVKETASRSDSAATSGLAKNVTIKQIDPKMIGTATAVETIAKNDSSTEAAAEDKEATDEQTKATTDLTTVNQVGDSFNESTLF